MKRNITHREKSEHCFLSLSYSIHLFLSAQRAFWICWCHELSLGPGFFPRLGLPAIHFFSSPYICSPSQPWVPEHGPTARCRNTGKQITGHRPSTVLNSPWTSCSSCSLACTTSSLVPLVRKLRWAGRGWSSMLLSPRHPKGWKAQWFYC